MKTPAITLAVACQILTACSIPAGRRDRFTVNKPFAVVAARVSIGVKTELEHGMTLSEDTVIARRIDLSNDALHFQLVQHAPDIGARTPFGNLYIRKSTPTISLIEVIETPQTYGSEPYLAEKISLWFPESQRTELPLEQIE
jgi:hypothetical protein